jgi:hypothetical protein
MARISCQIFATRERGTPWTEEQIDRTAWPWHSAPADCTDYDEATWYACRKSSGGVLPRQDLDTWVQRQRASRDVWPSRPAMIGAEHAQLRADLAAAWREEAGRGTPVPLCAQAVAHTRAGRAALVDIANRVANSPEAVDLSDEARRIAALIRSRDLEPGNAWHGLRSAALYAGLTAREVDTVLAAVRGDRDV